MSRQTTGRRSRLGSHVGAGICIAMVASAASGAAPPQPTGTEMVDTMKGLFGPQQDHRAIHAKGFVVEGRFFPDAAAAGLTRAAQFSGGPEPVVVRFSSFAGLTTLADSDGLSTPRGMAIKLHRDGAADVDIVAHSFNGFPTSNAGEFRELLTALGHSGPGAPKPTEADRFLATHPAAKAFLEHGTPPPASFATLPYFGVNAFRFTNAAGAVSSGRYQLVPAAGSHFLSAKDAGAAAHDYLETELRRRLAQGPVEFTLRVQLAADGDRLDDPSIAWPDTRRTVTLGRLRIERVAKDSNAAEHRLMFSPANMPDGVEAADPMIGVRGESYGVSFGRRQQNVAAERQTGSESAGAQSGLAH